MTLVRIPASSRYLNLECTEGYLIIDRSILQCCWMLVLDVEGIGTEAQ